jgi:hypothetical protein
MTWQTLVPDPSHTFCTTASFVAAKTATGSQAVIYGSSASMTVVVSQMSGPFVQARWYDPTNGTYATDSASPFANTGSHVFAAHGTNAGGGTDWVLVLESVPGTWSNEPAGFTLQSNLDFSVAFPAGSSDQAYTGGWGITGYNRSPMLVTRISDPSAPLSPPWVAKYSYPIGFGGGTEPGDIYLDFSPAVTDIFLGMRLLISNPFQGHPTSGVNKICFALLGNSDQMYIAMRNSRTIYIAEELTSESFRNYEAGTGGQAATAMSLGAYHTIEWRMRKSPSLMEWWLDGVKQGTTTSEVWPSASFNHIQIAPTWGGTGSSKTEDDYYYYDHIYISHG